MAKQLSPDDPSRQETFLNRELSLLEFQSRVLAEAQDPDNPLLERVKFLAILGSNLDEFFMVRVGGLLMQQKTGVVRLSIDGLTPAEQLAAIRKNALELMGAGRQCFREVIQAELNAAGIHVLDYEQLSEKQKNQAQKYYDEFVYPVLTPLAFDPGHPFPHISNLSFNLAVVIRGQNGDEHFARVKVPATLPRLLPIKRSSGGVRKDGTVPHHHFFVWLEQVVAAHLSTLFPGMEVVEAYPFRVTRNADLEIQELEAADLLEIMRENVQERQFGDVVRLEITHRMPATVRDILVENLQADQKDVYKVKEPMDLSGLWQLHHIDRYELKYKFFSPSMPQALKSEKRDGSIFAAIRQGDILLHHPYESFDPVIELLRTAAHDSQVLAIKQTLYRVGSESPIVNYLREARRTHRKQVAVLVELKARFDEESNIGWAQMLEREGVHVTYGLMGLKTHAKILLVVRREGEHIRRYVHLSTGNYNQATARQYEDIGMFTCDEEIGRDATDLFNFLTGYSAKQDYRKLIVAPINLRQRLQALIEREIEIQSQGGQGYLILKTNALMDKAIIRLLYAASRAGVRVDLIVRSICGLRPQVADLSENIQVRSIVGRFLEHSRIYYFQNGGQAEIYLGSADLMTRNIDRRVETLFPVLDTSLVKQIHDQVLQTYLADNSKARRMLADGQYERCRPGDKEEELDSQARLLAHYNQQALEVIPSRTRKKS